MSKEKNNHWALILGASSGFGEAICVKLAQDGYNIAGVHLDRAATMHNVERITKAIEAAGAQHKFFNANAADEKKREEVIKELTTLAEGKAIVKILVHSLAFGTLKGFTKLTDDVPITKAQMEMTLDVMAHSLVYWTQDLVANELLVRKARIFGMTSSGGHTVIPAYGAVSAAKATLESHIRQLAYELGPMEVAVNSIMAGVTETPALKKIPGSEPMMQVAERKNPRSRLTTPDDIAKVISVLCMDGAEWISGGLIHADGGEDIVNFVGQGKKGNL